MLFGYARVSTEVQNLDMQIDLLKLNGVEECNIYTDKDSGSKNDRNGLNDLLKLLRKGDKVVFFDLFRLSRDVKYLFVLVENFQLKGVDFQDLTNSFIDSDSVKTTEGELVFGLFALIGQFFRRNSNDKIKRGLEAARQRGKVGGRKKGMTQRLKDIAPATVLMHNNPETSIADIRKAFKIAQASVYACFKHEGYDYKSQHKNTGNNNRNKNLKIELIK